MRGLWPLAVGLPLNIPVALIFISKEMFGQERERAFSSFDRVQPAVEYDFSGEETVPERRETAFREIGRRRERS